MNAKNPKPIREGVASVLDNLGINRKVREYNVLDMWNDVVGEQIARVTTAEYFSGGKLLIRVSRATWRNELVFLKQQLIQKLNAAMREEIVRDIIFK